MRRDHDAALLLRGCVDFTNAFDAGWLNRISIRRNASSTASKAITMLNAVACNITNRNYDKRWRVGQVCKWNIASSTISARSNGNACNFDKFRYYIIAVQWLNVFPNSYPFAYSECGHGRRNTILFSSSWPFVIEQFGNKQIHDIVGCILKLIKCNSFWWWSNMSSLV